MKTVIFSRHSEVYSKTLFLISTPSFRLPVTTKLGRVNEASLQNDYYELHLPAE
jgi:hypothetical protein